MGDLKYSQCDIISKMNSNQNKFIIVDFGASLMHTHHKQSIFAFAHLFETKKIDYEIWVPLGSKIKNPKYKIRRILLPGTHPCAFELTRFSSWIPGLLAKIRQFASVNKLTLLTKLSVEITANYFLFILRLYKLQSVKILFPTACSFTYRAIEVLESEEFSSNIFCRLTNSSETGRRSSSDYNFQDLILDSSSFKNAKVKYGIETNAYMNKLASLGSKNLFISKFPFIDSVSDRISSDSDITVAFLGHPTVHKGHNDILPIIKSVLEVRKDIKFQVQLYDNDPLEQELKKFGSSVLIFSGKISSDKLESALRMSSVMCLPYDVSAFKFNSSAMMYHALNYNIPIYTYTGTAFAEDVKEYDCGYTVSNYFEMADLIKKTSISSLQNLMDGCYAYNNFRNNSNFYFLEI